MPPDTVFPAFLTAPLSPGDSEEMRFNKSLLILASCLISAASLLWMLLYWLQGARVSLTIPLLLPILLIGNLLLFFRHRDFARFRSTQLGLFLLIPFVAQWCIGDFIAASGISLWALLAPIGAILFFGVRESLSWFVAYLCLSVLSGSVDFYLTDSSTLRASGVPLRTSIFFFTLNFSAVSSIVYLLLRFASLEKLKIQAGMADAHRMLKEEQERSEKLLLNILPGPVADRLKNSNQTIADGFADVTVMFADIVNFTKVAEGLSPQQVFSMLNRIFSSFDELAEAYGLEKIKTIGDAYMVAGGLGPGNDQYSAAIAEFALALQDLLHRDFEVNRMHLDVRIGIGTGPVVAGVVGKHKFIYDLWGDTVNIASRITTEGAPGMIQVDETTYQRLCHRFDFLAPQLLHLKGKGDMTVYRLTGKKAPAPTAGNSILARPTAQGDGETSGG